MLIHDRLVAVPVRAVTPAVLACCALLFTSSRGLAQTAPLDARAGIQAAHVRLDSVSRAGDARANADVYTPDAVVSLGTLDDVRGRDALYRAMAGFYQRNVVQAHRLTTVELEVYGDTAYDRGTYLFVSGPRGRPATTDRGRYFAMWVRGADGVWRIHRYLENLLPASKPQ